MLHVIGIKIYMYGQCCDCLDYLSRIRILCSNQPVLETRWLNFMFKCQGLVSEVGRLFVDIPGWNWLLYSGMWDFINSACH
jgi:hypothetical protein